MSTDHPDDAVASMLAVPLVVDSIAAPRLVYGRLDVTSTTGEESAYPALYFDIADSTDLGRVTFEGLDAVRGSRGEYLPYRADRYVASDWAYVVDQSSWLRERHRYEMQHYSTALLDTHRHYLFAFHDYFVEAIAEGVWFDVADRTDPFAPPSDHPLAELPLATPAQRHTSAEGLEWELRRSPRTLDELVDGSRYCSQRMFQFNLVLDGTSKPTASIWLRTINDVTTSRFSLIWPIGETARVDGTAGPDDFSAPWNTYLSGVAERRHRTRPR